VVKKTDLERIIKIMGFIEKTGREMLWPEQLEDVLEKLLQSK
jgi:hypothetical protein